MRPWLVSANMAFKFDNGLTFKPLLTNMRVSGQSCPCTELSFDNCSSVFISLNLSKFCLFVTNALLPIYPLNNGILMAVANDSRSGLLILQNKSSELSSSDIKLRC